MSEPPVGSSFQSFLEEQVIAAEVDTAAMAAVRRLPTIPDLLRHIRERDSGTTYHAGSVPRWDTLLADEVERLQAAIRRHRADVWAELAVGHPEDAELYRAAGLPNVVLATTTELAGEVKRLQALLREATTGRMTPALADRVWDAAGCGWGERG